ncbi:MAG TPA: hypothetical protein VK452_02115 [Dissulfurispiraceae bacterium]|nr:hypothetical protein [Dissulfurispiraceae bacterium]
MKICVCGWYFYEDFYMVLKSVYPAFDIMIIANKPGDTLGLPYILRENIGLEWGAYSYYLDNCWDGTSSVLFMHDDTKVDSDFFTRIQRNTFDQAFIFKTEFDYQQSYSHGRAFYASAPFLQLCRENGGIYYDKGNKGFIAPGYSWSTTPPEGCKDHNVAIREFTQFCKGIAAEYPDLTVNKQIYDSTISLGIRGKFRV